MLVVGGREGGWEGGRIVITIRCSSFDAAECPQICQNAGLLFTAWEKWSVSAEQVKDHTEEFDTFFIIISFFKQITIVNVTFKLKKSCKNTFRMM